MSLGPNTGSSGQNGEKSSSRRGGTKRTDTRTFQGLRKPTLGFKTAEVSPSRLYDRGLGLVWAFRRPQAEGDLLSQDQAASQPLPSLEKSFLPQLNQCSVPIPPGSTTPCPLCPAPRILAGLEDRREGSRMHRLQPAAPTPSSLSSSRAGGWCNHCVRGCGRLDPSCFPALRPCSEHRKWDLES